MLNTDLTISSCLTIEKKANKMLNHFFKTDPEHNSYQPYIIAVAPRRRCGSSPAVMINKIMTSSLELLFLQTASVSKWERCCMEREGMIELNTLQTVTMRGIHLFWCQAGNLEAVGAFPAPTLALTGWEPSHRHIHQHMFLDTFQEQRQHIQITQSIPRAASPQLQGFGQEHVLSKSHACFSFAAVIFLFALVYHSYRFI